MGAGVGSGESSFLQLVKIAVNITAVKNKFFIFCFLLMKHKSKILTNCKQYHF